MISAVFDVLLGIHVAVNVCINCSFLHLYLRFLKISVYGKISPMAYHNVGLLVAK